MLYRSSFSVLQTIGALALIVLCWQAAPAGAGQNVVLLEAVPGYASLESAQKGGEPDETLPESLSGLDGPDGEILLYAVAEERDGWVRLQASDAAFWVKKPSILGEEQFLADSRFRKYTACPESLPYSFPVDIGPGLKDGTLKMATRPTVTGGALDAIELYDAAGAKIWTSIGTDMDPGMYCKGDDPHDARLIRVVGDLDGDGMMEAIIAGGVRFDVAPETYDLLRWSGKGLDIVCSFSLEEKKDATVWRLERTPEEREAMLAGDEGWKNAGFAYFGGIQGNPDGSVDFEMANAGGLLGVARMRLDRSGKFFTLEKWVKRLDTEETP